MHAWMKKSNQMVMTQTLQFSFTSLCKEGCRMRGENVGQWSKTKTRKSVNPILNKGLRNYCKFKL